MKQSLIALALVGAFTAPVFAEEAAAPAAETPALTGNMTIASSYRFRGIDQTFGKPAIQGGIDYSHAATGLYIGNWNSTISSGAGYPEGNVEMDFYGGWKTTFAEDFGVDVGALYYRYPGSRARPLSGTNAKHPSANASGTVDNLELYVAGSWKFLTLKYSYAVSDYFDLPESKGTSYLEFNGNYDLGDGWGVNGHVGHLFAKDYKYASASLTGSDSISYTDWKFGVTKDLSGWVVGLSYVGTNAKGSCNKGEFYCFTNSLNESGNTGSKAKDAGRGIAVLSVTKTF